MAALDIASLAVSPYQNRHGGASRDHLGGLRTVFEIRRRGRWASDSSARVYDKPGRLQQITSQYEGRYRKFGDHVREHFAELYRTGKVKLPKGVKLPAC